MTGSIPAPARNREETVAEIKRMRDLHDKWAAEAFDRNDNTNWQYHSGHASAYNYVLYLFQGLS